MASNVDPHQAEDYPDDVQSHEGGPVPLFLKIVYVGFTAFGIWYFVAYIAGDTSSKLVQAFNAATGH